MGTPPHNKAPPNNAQTVATPECKDSYQEKRGHEWRGPQQATGKIEKLVWTDPEDMLPGDEHLLDEDFDALGRASAIDQLLWVAEVEASIEAVNYGTRSNKDSGNTKEATKDNNSVSAEKTSSKSEKQDSAGSGRRKKERKK